MDESLESKFTSLKAKNLKIDLTRGKPGTDQLVKPHWLRQDSGRPRRNPQLG